MPLYPLPPLVAMGDLSSFWLSEPCTGRIGGGAGIGVSGTLIYLVALAAGAMAVCAGRMNGGGGVRGFSTLSQGKRRKMGHGGLWDGW